MPNYKLSYKKYVENYGAYKSYENEVKIKIINEDDSTIELYAINNHDTFKYNLQRFGVRGNGGGQDRTFLIDNIRRTESFHAKMSVLEINDKMLDLIKSKKETSKLHKEVALSSGEIYKIQEIAELANHRGFLAEAKSGNAYDQQLTSDAELRFSNAVSSIKIYTDKMLNTNTLWQSEEDNKVPALDDCNPSFRFSKNR